MKQLCALALALACAVRPAIAQEPQPVLSLELNGQTAAEAGCMLTFVVRNGHAQDIDRLVLETVLFDGTGEVDRLTLFDFGAVPPGLPRVRQFQVDGMACDDIGQVLINGASTCSVGGSDSTICGTLTVQSRTDTELLG